MAPLFKKFSFGAPARKTVCTAAAFGLFMGLGSVSPGPYPVSEDSRRQTEPWYRRSAPWQPPSRTATAFLFSERTGTDNPTNGEAIPFRSAPAFIDIDGDLDLDLILGDVCGGVVLFENTGTANSPAFDAVDQSSNPFNVIALGANGAPTLVDIDNDLDLDVFVGVGGINNALSGAVRYYENTGTGGSPAFLERTGTANPLDVNIGKEAAPTFVDIDDDGDFDAFVGEGGVTISSGQVNYFENTGTSTTPAFIERRGSDNPLSFVDFGPGGIGDAKPTFVDLDGDGDFDVFGGDEYGLIHFFENTGTSDTAAFVERTGILNPFDGVDVGGNASPTFVDIDTDGDFDLFIGENNYSLNFFLNLDAALPVEITSFDAVIREETILLRWDTAGERNNAGFEIQRSAARGHTPDDWNAVAFVAGAGTTNEPQHYQFPVANPSPGIHRFRLKHIDFGGNATYSRVVEVRVDLFEPYRLTAAYPDPFNSGSTFSLAVDRAQHVTVTVYNSIGRRMAVLFDGELSSGATHRFTIESNGWPSGVYTYHVAGERFKVGRTVLLVN